MHRKLDVCATPLDEHYGRVSFPWNFHRLRPFSILSQRRFFTRGYENSQDDRFPFELPVILPR